VADERDEERVASRAAALEAEEPELAGDDDEEAEAQAAAMLADSDDREAQASSPDRGGGQIEHRHSEDTVEPPP
jgi:hypothetical protein